MFIQGNRALGVEGLGLSVFSAQLECVTFWVTSRSSARGPGTRNEAVATACCKKLQAIRSN